jgi:hypothetical protein
MIIRKTLYNGTQGCGLLDFYDAEPWFRTSHKEFF